MQPHLNDRQTLTWVLAPGASVEADLSHWLEYPTSPQRCAWPPAVIPVLVRVQNVESMLVPPPSATTESLVLSAMPPAPNEPPVLPVLSLMPSPAGPTEPPPPSVSTSPPVLLLAPSPSAPSEPLVHEQIEGKTATWLPLPAELLALQVLSLHSAAPPPASSTEPPLVLLMLSVVPPPAQRVLVRA